MRSPRVCLCVCASACVSSLLTLEYQNRYLWNWCIYNATWVNLKGARHNFLPLVMPILYSRSNCLGKTLILLERLTLVKLGKNIMIQETISAVYSINPFDL
jgi:hypothetical protein